MAAMRCVDSQPHPLSSSASGRALTPISDASKKL